MKQKTTLTVGCLSAALMCAPAVGSDFQGRWYFGLGGGMSQLEPDTDDSQYALDDTEDTSVRLVLGRDLTNRLSAEVYLADLGEVTFTPKAGAVNPVADPSVGYQVGGAHLLFYYYNSDGDDGRHYRDSFAAYFKLGAGTMENDSNVEYQRIDDLHLSFGLGAEGLIANGFSWRADFEMYDEDASQFSVSLVKRFGHTAVAAAPVAAVATEVAEVAEEPVDPVLEADRKLDTMMKEQTADKTMTMASEEVPALLGEPVVSDAPAVVAPVIANADTDTMMAESETVAETVVATSNDSDQDGVLDADDRCPGTENGLAVDERGCAFSGIVEGLYFDRGSDELNSSAKSILDNVVLELRRFPTVVLEVQAHTDNRGKATDNLALSQRRAESVANYMVDRGISGNRIRARGFGESRPAFANATEEGRMRNRRVVFQTVEKLM